MAVFMRTPSAPSSMATAASEAVPTPASTIIGTSVMRSRRMRRLAGFCMPRPEPMGAASGMTAAAPASMSLRAAIEIVVGVGQNDEAFLHQDARGFDELFGIREKSLLVADDFQLDPIGKADFAAEARGADGFVGGVAGGGVRQDEDFFAVDVSRAAIPWICR